MSVDLHAAQSQGFFDGPVDHLVAMPVLVDYIRDRFPRAISTTSPSSPPTPAAFAWPSSGRSVSAAVRSAFVHKTRDITRPNRRSPTDVVGDVAGKDCVLVDDLIDTAGTIAGACHVLRTREPSR